jgi:hypothetical protein
MKKLGHLLILTLIIPGLVFGQATQNPDSLDGQFSNPTNLTDTQMDQAKNFTHQGIKERVVKEKCAAVNDCRDDEGFPIEMMIGKAYSLIGMFTGDGLKPTLKMKTPEAAKTPDTPKAGTTGATGDAAKKNEKPDYCMMISMAYETLGGMIQQAYQRKAENTTVKGDEQLQALVSLQETHKARMKTAKFQSYIYAGVTSCYAAMLFTGAAADTSFILKMSGSAALTGLYLRKANKHKKAVNKVGEVIASLDWAGKNCNPWTKSACFCSEKTSKDLYPSEFQEVCILNKGNFETPKIALGCAAVVDKKLQYDTECKCKSNNSCMKSNLMPYASKIGLGANLMAEANKTFDLLGTGDLDQGQLDRASIKAASMAASMKFNDADKIKSPELTADQKKMADELKQFMPQNAANLAASTQPTPSRSGIKETPIGASAISKLPPTVQGKLADAIDVGYKTAGNSSNSERGTEPDFEMPIMPGQEAETSEGTEVLTFAEKAISKADVSNAPSTPIFDIISNRYKRSGWSKLDTVGK